MPIVNLLDSKILAFKLLDMDSDKTADVLDRIISEWRKVLPGLDPSPLEVVGRILVLAQRLEKSVNEALETHGLTLGQFDILATLRRNSPRGELSPRELLKNVALSSGGMTARLDKLEQAGLIQRKPDPNDRRMLTIELTAEGRDDHRSRRSDALPGSAAIASIVAGIRAGNAGEVAASLARHAAGTLTERCVKIIFRRRA